MNIKWNKKAQNRTGATTVEFAFVLPVILVMFLGAIEVTRLNFLRQTALNAAYEGARACIVPGATPADGQAEAMRLLTAVSAHRGATVNVNMQQAVVNVTITIPLSQNSWGLGRFATNANVVRNFSLKKEM
ncbi:MAG: pilus assembly protein [Pirellula sp.]|jgi:Flp pilus assembly protein TadG|nr:pilus assembly protein [Pirellula sp.]